MFMANPLSSAKAYFVTYEGMDSSINKCIAFDFKNLAFANDYPNNKMWTAL